MNFTRRSLLGTFSFLSLKGLAADKPDLSMQLEAIRARHDLPALAGGLVTLEGLQQPYVVGVRKRGTDIAATVDDLWHLGSNTKAMTSTLAALAVAKGKLRWDSTVGEVFPKVRELKKSQLAAVTLTQLLTHWSGLPATPSGASLPCAKTACETNAPPCWRW